MLGGGGVPFALLILVWVTLTLLCSHSLQNRTNKSVKEWVKNRERQLNTRTSLAKTFLRVWCQLLLWGNLQSQERRAICALPIYCTLRLWTWSNYNWRMCVDRVRKAAPPPNHVCVQHFIQFLAYKTPPPPQQVSGGGWQARHSWLYRKSVQEEEEPGSDSTTLSLR